MPQGLTRMTFREAIADVPALEPTACSCEACQAMCRRGPCLGTPQDILRIVVAGEGDKLAVTDYRALESVGIPRQTIMAPLLTPDGCAFLKDGLCTLHDRGLKPTEGRLSGCKRAPIHSLAIPAYVLLQWQILAEKPPRPNEPVL